MTPVGVAQQYLFLNITLWWFFHVCMVFYKVNFPFHSRKTVQYNTHIHIVCALIGKQICVSVSMYYNYFFVSALLLPLPAVISTLAKDGYRINRFPPILCSPRNSDLFYYPTMLVMNILLAVGVALLIITFWKVHKVQITTSVLKP